MPDPVPATRPLNVALVKHVAATNPGKCYLGLANAICVDDVDYIIVANTKDQLETLAKTLGRLEPLLPNKFFAVAVVHEAAVTLEDDEL